MIRATGSSNTCFSAGSLDDAVTARPFLERRLQAAETDRLCSHISTLRRWVKYHDCEAPKEDMCWKPSPLLLARFLQHVAQGGPTASVTVFSSLRWWASKLRVPFPLDDAQRTALGPAHFLAMAGYLNGVPGTAPAFIAWTLLTTLACLCFAHVQRSTDLRIQGGFLVGLCTNGKRRIAGTRAPFRWAAPAEQLKDSRSIKLIRYGNKVGNRLATSSEKWFPLCARKIAEAFAEALRLRKLLQKLLFFTPPNPERKLMEMEGS